MKFKLELNTKSIEKLIDLYDLLGNQIDEIIDKSLAELAETGLTLIRDNLAHYGLASSRIASTLKMVKTEKGFQLIATGEVNNGLSQAVLVEFGTGIVGAWNPHELADQQNYEYDIDRDNKGYQGWWYPTDENDRNRTKYVTESGTMIAFTRGMPSRPFMYNTQIELQGLMAEVLRKYLKAAIM